MRPNQYIRQEIKSRPEPGLGRMIALSFIVHLVILGLFSGVLFPRMIKPPRPVYVVDLVNLPVKDPQAGRPDARPQQEKKDKKTESAVAHPESKPEVVKLPPKSESKPEPKPQPKSEPKPTRKVEPKPEPKAVAKPIVKAVTKPMVMKNDNQQVSNAIEDMRRKKAIEDLKRKNEELASKDTRAAVDNAPVGMPDGKGTDAGIGDELWLQNFLKEAWRLSKYQVDRPDAEATVRLIFNSQGRLIDYKFVKKSGDSRFDDSVKRALLELNEISQKSFAGMEQEVVFNLKDLLQ